MEQYNVGIPTLQFNTITENKSVYGGAIFCISPAVIEHNILTNNIAQTAGGGISCFIGQDSLIIAYNFIANNSSTEGGGIEIEAGKIIVHNNVIANNLASLGGGIFIYSPAKFINNTVVNNLALENGGAIYFFNNNAYFKNCIFWGNSAIVSGDQIAINQENSDPDFIYCNIEKGRTNFELGGTNYTGKYQFNLDLDPLFVSPSRGLGNNSDFMTANWSLATGSPCIDAGDTAGPYPDFDIAGNTRVVNGRINMGAYEAKIKTGVVNLVDYFSVAVYPNPNHGIFNIQTNANSIYKIEIWNAIGTLVETLENLHNGSTIDLNQYPSGIYFLQIKDANHRMVLRKIVKE